jgi:hypothetical protein
MPLPMTLTPTNEVISFENHAGKNLLIGGKKSVVIWEVKQDERIVYYH